MKEEGCVGLLVANTKLKFSMMYQIKIRIRNKKCERSEILDVEVTSHVACLERVYVLKVLSFQS